MAIVELKNVSRVYMTVTPDHQDWNYRVGDKANFTVNVRKSGTLLNQVKVDYEAGPAMFQIGRAHV